MHVVDCKAICGPAHPYPADYTAPSQDIEVLYQQSALLKDDNNHVCKTIVCLHKRGVLGERTTTVQAGPSEEFLCKTKNAV